MGCDALAAGTGGIPSAVRSAGLNFCSVPRKCFLSPLHSCCQEMRRDKNILILLALRSKSLDGGINRYCRGCLLYIPGVKMADPGISSVE